MGVLMIQEYAGDAGPGRWQAAGRILSPYRDELDQTARVAYPPPLEGLTGTRWLRLAAEMAGLASGNWRPAPDLASTGPVRLPRVAMRTIGADVGSVRAARDFAIATLRRWGTTERSQDIAIVVSELLTNALRHALPESAQPGSSSSRAQRPIRFGLLQPGSCVLCAVADPSRAAPVLQTRGSLAETGRGLHIICALSDQWGYAASDTGKVVWAMFCSRLTARLTCGCATCLRGSRSPIASLLGVLSRSPAGAGRVSSYPSWLGSGIPGRAVRVVSLISGSPGPTAGRRGRRGCAPGAPAPGACRDSRARRRSCPPGQPAPREAGSQPPGGGVPGPAPPRHDSPQPRGLRSERGGEQVIGGRRNARRTRSGRRCRGG
jgi:anti-sigma regulatory factor (Ser/Thr protein kinase)